MTVRARLSLTYAALLAVSGTVMLVMLYAYMRYVPDYAIESSLGSGSPGQAIALPTPAAPLPPNANDASGIRITSADDVLQSLSIASIVVLIVMVLASGWAGWIISGRLLRPLHAINEAALRAGTGTFDHRIGLTGPRDEIKDLSDTFDGMLEKLDQSFHAHQRFAANASHELQTPLATTKAILDLALASPETSLSDFRVLAQRLRETNERSIQTVDALLDLADIGQVEVSVDHVDLAHILGDSLGALSDEIDHRQLDVTLNCRPAVIEGNAVMLGRLATNLLQNAIKHNVLGGDIQIVVGPDSIHESEISLTVTNSGKVIEQASIAKLTEPFYRDGGRVVPAGVASRGLGLAIVESITAAHNGRLALGPRAGGGLIATVSFPSHSTFAWEGQ
ncbi:HAMP domain-containing sensor histidine kinase [Arthrobacter sp. GMC3]|uniref:HAMP domain-containing sensor histidine kinase n=1 Tax=Arthrobacter sp. GMC3 TaxID=2058894 RepID=UPI0015E2E248|nr:HAMP domain-containing sensor histidine kinase [Arthrobacter sp. GMC3]